MDMFKDSAIRRFKNCCANPANDDRRELAVIKQFNRNTFELDDDFGRIRIDGERLCITIFHTIDYAKINGYTDSFVSPITKEEFDELKKMFFGDYKEDREYLTKLGVKFPDQRNPFMTDPFDTSFDERQNMIVAIENNFRTVFTSKVVLENYSYLFYKHQEMIAYVFENYPFLQSKYGLTPNMNYGGMVLHILKELNKQ